MDNHKPEQALDVINWGINLYPDHYFTPSLYLTKSYVLEQVHDINAAIKVCESGLNILESNKEKMNQEDYKYTLEDLTNRLQELLSKNHVIAR